MRRQELQKNTGNRKKQRDINTIALSFGCVHVLEDGTQCPHGAVDGSQYCEAHRPEQPAVPSEAPLAIVGEAMEGLKSDLENATVLDHEAKRIFAELQDKDVELPSPDGEGVEVLSGTPAEEREVMIKSARDSANIASRIRSRAINSMLDLTKLGLLAGPKGKTPHEVAAQRMRDLGLDEETVKKYRDKHAVPSADEDGEE